MSNRMIFLGAWVVVCAMITYQEIHYCHDLPFPPRFIYAALTFGILDLSTIFIPELGALIAGGMVLGFGLCTLRPNGACAKFAPSCKREGTEQPFSYHFIQDTGPGETPEGPAIGMGGTTTV